MYLCGNALIGVHALTILPIVRKLALIAPR